MKLGVSTAVLGSRPIEELIAAAREHGFFVEFSSGLEYREDLEQVFLEADCERIPHNYFPPPAEPFVLNLASADPAIRRRSVEHCRRGLRLAEAVGAPFYSAHAGFMGDISPADLGATLRPTNVADRSAHWRWFIDSVAQLVEEAEQRSISFLLENNVVSPANATPGGEHPLLCAEAAEMAALVKALSTPALGLLLDSGHLNVTARTLGFRPERVLDVIGDRARAVHHSNNNGRDDVNASLTPDYWFLPFVRQFSHCHHVLEVRDQPLDSILRQLHLLQAAACTDSAVDEGVQ